MTPAGTSTAASRSRGEPPPWNYGVNIWSQQRALLVLMLYSDVGPDDAPTSDQRRVARRHGPGPGAVRRPPAPRSSTRCRRAPTRSGARSSPPRARAGDAYLCHPFLLHAAQLAAPWHRRPRFIGPAVHLPPATSGRTPTGD